MNKKYLFLLPLLLLSSCNSSETTASTTSQAIDIQPLKDLLSKQDKSVRNHKGLAANYVQEYQTKSKHKDDEEEVISNVQYQAKGGFKFLYAIEEEEYRSLMENEEVYTYDLLTAGDGYYRAMLNSKLVTYDYLKSEDENYEENQTLGIFQDLKMKSDSLQFQVDSDYYFDETGEGYDPEHASKFNGAIQVSTLNEGVTPRQMDGIFAQTVLFDAPINISYIDDLYYQLVEELEKDSDQDIQLFVQKHHIEVLDGEEVDISFLIEKEDFDKYMGEKDDALSGDLKGHLYFEKEKGTFSHFQYTLMETYVEGSESSTDYENVRFQIEVRGSSARDLEDEMTIKKDPEINTDGEAFALDLVDHIVPPRL